MEKFNVYLINEDLSKSLIQSCASEQEALLLIDEKQKADENAIVSLEFENDFGTVVIF